MCSKMCIRDSFLGDVGKDIKADLPRIGGSASDNHLGLMLLGQLANLIIVNGLGFRIQVIGNHIIIITRNIHRAAVGQVTTVGQVHAQNGVAGLDQRIINGNVGRSTRCV